MYKPLKKLENWMIEKEEVGKGLSGHDGNGAYFWDFETMKMYSPFDDELLEGEDRSFYIEDESEEVKEAYNKFKNNSLNSCKCTGFQLLHYGCECKL